MVLDRLVNIVYNVSTDTERVTRDNREREKGERERMSAYVVDKAHIDAILRAAEALLQRAGYGLTWYARDPAGMTDQERQAAYRRLDHSDLDEVGQMLLDECVASVGDRYQDDGITDLPGPIDAYWLIPYKYDRRAGEGPGCSAPSPVETLKLVHCYIYQSCEHDGWKDSEARRFCRALEGTSARLVPGYDEAPWGWPPEPEPVAAVVVVQRPLM